MQKVHARSRDTAPLAGRDTEHGDRATVALADIALAARIGAPAMLVGGSQAARLAVAHEIHDRSARRLRPFVVTIATHWLGDLRDASARARAGTLFVDGLEAMSAAEQLSLLALVEAQEPSGGGSARLLTGARPELFTQLARGRFAERLFWRLNVIRIDLTEPTPETDLVFA